MKEKLNGITISSSVPACPHCSGIVRKIFAGEDILYRCADCKKTYKILGPGQAENEVICEEIKYER